MSDVMKSSKREYRNINILQISKYRLPINAKVSILHRISGVFLFLSLPFLLYVLNQSVISQSFFDMVKGCLAATPIKIASLIIIGAYLFHFCAGCRHLLLDLHIGIEKRASKRSAALVVILSILLIVLVALKIFGVFS